MSTVNVLESDIISWVKKIRLNNFTINVQGTTEKGDGYTGEIVFVSVNGDTNENKKRVLNLVIKHGKSNDHLRKTMPIRKAFEIEMHIYDKVMPAFKKFQEEKGIFRRFR
ncbi:hypothetical protein NQ317_017769 [Molorchus minor]|uniref:LAGLIDADG homing endonuclease n=1 Tax=Molorchus minor TaxID=1323400 RepID=A0ABQ9JHF6_9CUCU|nr:hypothetical protein NQ317_017769 [Molorchus minor]